MNKPTARDLCGGILCDPCEALAQCLATEGGKYTYKEPAQRQKRKSGGTQCLHEALENPSIPQNHEGQMPVQAYVCPETPGSNASYYSNHSPQGAHLSIIKVQ